MATSKEPRQQRRQAERKARKAANRAGLPTTATPTDAPPEQPRPTNPFPAALDYEADGPKSLAEFLARRTRQAAERETEESIHANRNRRNAQLSTGPKTAEGKARASQNAIRHGLSSDKFLVFEWENLDDFIELLQNLREEHQPATQTEALLVEQMAQHFWLSQRALRLQSMCFHRELPLCEEPKQMALYMRYEASHERAFHKCLAELNKLRANHRKEEVGFVSQQRQAAAERRKEELHTLRIASAAAKTATATRKNTRPSSPGPMAAPLPAVGYGPLTPSLTPDYAESAAKSHSHAA